MLASFVARSALVGLLRGRTWAGGRVLNSPLEPLEELLSGDAVRPMIAVFSGTYKGDVTGRELTGARNDLDIIIQLYIPPVTSDGEESDLDGWMPDPMRGAAPALDILWRQVVCCLQGRTGDWNDIWNGVVARYTKVDSRPILIEGDEGIRIPCREITLSCVTISDPPLGEPLRSTYADFEQKLRDGCDEALADVFKAAAEAPESLPDWQIAIAAMGWSRTAAAAVGFSEPLVADDDGNPVTVTEIVIDGGLETGDPL